MCVIFVVKDARPSEQLIDKAWDRNPHGGGVAWRDTTSKGSVVKWRKGLDKATMKELCAKLPTPFIAHFRIPSTGPDGKSPEFCHPFEISETAVPKLNGTTSRSVLFHNGTWNSWKYDTKEAVGKTGVKLPPGEWNDTRSLAHMAVMYGEGILSMIDEKVVVLGPDKDALNFYGKGWSLVEGIMVSNQLFLNTTSETFRTGQQATGSVSQNTSVSGASRSHLIQQASIKDTVVTKLERTGGSAGLLDLPFRGYIRPVSEWLVSARREADQQKAVQQGQEQVLPGAEEGEGSSTEEEARTVTVLSTTPSNPKRFRGSGRQGDPITTPPKPSIRFLGEVRRN